MKLVIAGIALTLAGCVAGPPLTFNQRMAIANYMQRSRYVVPQAPQMAPIPQTHTASCYTSGNYTNCTVN